MAIFAKDQPHCPSRSASAVYQIYFSDENCDVSWPGRSDLQSQLDAAVDDLKQKMNAVQEVERNAVRAAMLEERARYCLFIGAIKPLIV